jgi:hypothetical protein
VQPQRRRRLRAHGRALVPLARWLSERWSRLLPRTHERAPEGAVGCCLAHQVQCQMLDHCQQRRFRLKVATVQPARCRSWSRRCRCRLEGETLPTGACVTR